MNFLYQLNGAIPQETNISEKIEILRKNRNIVNRLNIIDDADKTVLIGEKRLSSDENTFSCREMCPDIPGKVSEATV